MARTILRDRYGLDSTRLDFLNHREGVTFRVHRRDANEDFHLRIHNPIPGRLDAFYQPDVVASALMWLEALDRDLDLTVQKPVRDRDGDLVSLVDGPDGRRQLCCALLHWINGVDGNQMPGRTLLQINRIGALMARLHDHAAGWDPPQGFTRPAWDAALLKSSVTELETAARSGKLAPADFMGLRQVAARADNLLERLKRDADTWGVIHGDLGHKGNCVYDRNNIWPIDFNDCAVGFFLHDIAHAFLYIGGAERRTFLEGYGSVRPLPDGAQTTIEGLMVIAQINLMARFAAHPFKRLDYAGRFLQRECTAFMRGKPFIFARSWWE